MKKILGFIFFFIVFPPLYAQEKIDSKINIRKATPRPIHGSLDFIVGGKTLACGAWEVCRNSSLNSAGVVGYGVDIFLPNSYWSVVGNLINSKSSHNNANYGGNEFVLEVLDIGLGIRHHHLSNSGKYSNKDFFYSIGALGSKVYYYPGIDPIGFSFSQDSACDIALICFTGTGTGYYVDIGLQFYLKRAYNIGFLVSQSSAAHVLTTDGLPDIDGDFGGTQYVVILGTVW